MVWGRYFKFGSPNPAAKPSSVVRRLFVVTARGSRYPIIQDLGPKSHKNHGLSALDSLIMRYPEPPRDEHGQVRHVVSADLLRKYSLPVFTAQQLQGMP